MYPTAHPVPSRPTVLLIEDDAEVSRLTGFVLRERFDMFSASDGQEGIRLAREKRPDLVLLDIYMRGMDGLEVCRRLKSDPATCRIPVAMYTAGAQRQEMERGYAAGADDYITKPFDPDDLLDRIQRLMEQKAPAVRPRRPGGSSP